VADDRRLADLLEALDELPCGLLRTDTDGLILRVNRTFCAWVGWERDDLVGQKRLQDLFTIGGRIFHQTHWQPLLQIQGSVAEVKLEIVHRDGHPIPMVINAIRRQRRETLVHEIAAYVAHDRDKYERELLSSRRKLQEAVEEAKSAQAQARDRALVAEQMMGVVSHDLRNPLSTISMGAALLTRLGATPQQQAVLERIKRATDRSNRLIADLLDFTQARLGGGLKLSPRPFALDGTVRDSVDELALAFAGRELKHRHSGPGEVVADPDRVMQLIGNLVANAMTYGDAQQPVEVETRVDDASFTVAVRNRGTPIDEALLPHLFEPLSRGDAKGEMRSLGLGLYIVDQIAKAHGGSVRVESGEVQGTIFEAQMPRRT
jgi:phosphoserine phosphatase RsbU/P